MKAVKTPKRRAVAQTRRERADATRRRIVDAAADLFRSPGYAATTMTAIAKRAGVAVQTVYFTFHTKTALLAAVADRAITGGRAPKPEQAEWVRNVFAEPDGRRRVALVVEGTASITPQMLPLIDAWRAAMSSDPSAAAQYRERLLARRAFLRRVVEAMRERGQLKPRLDPERATDLLFALTTPESYETHTRLLGWTIDEWKSWVIATVSRDVLR